MNVIGEAYVTITALADKFTADVKSSTDPAFSGLKDTAGAGGLAAGEELGAGVQAGTRGIEDELEKTGAASGGKFSSALSGGLSKLGNIVETASGGLIPMSKATDKVAGSLEDADKKGGGFSSTMGKLGGGVMLGAAAGFVAVGAEAVNLDEKFQSTTASIAAGGDISTAAANKIGAAFLDTAGKSTFSGQAIASSFAGVAGQVKMINGGVLDAAASMQVMDAATMLAEASGTSLDSSTKAVTNTLQAFGLGVKDSPLVANVLFNAARDTGQSVDTMGATIDKARAKMGAAAPSIQDLGGLLVDLTAHGETGKSAMTVLGSAFTGIVNPTKAVSDAQAAMGVSFLDANGKMKPIGDIIGQLGPKLAGMTQQQQIAALSSLGFGASSGKLLSTILAGPAAFDKSTESVSKAGSAHEAAEKQASTLKGQMETLKSSVQDAATKWGAVLIPVLEKVGKVLVEVGNYIVNHKALLIALGIAAAAVLLTMIGFWIGNAIAAMSFWVAATGGIIILVAAIAIGIAWLIDNWGKVWKFMKGIVMDVWDWIKEHWKLLLDILMGPIGFAIGFIISHFNQIKDVVMDVVNWITGHWQLLLAIITGPIGVAIFIIKSYWNDIVQWCSDAINAVTGFFSGLPGKITGFFAGIWDKIWASFKTVAVWLATNVEIPVIDWFKGLPAKVASVVVGFFDKAWAELKTVLTWIVLNVELPVINWVISLPGKVATAIGGFFDKAWAELKTVAVWVATNVETPFIQWVMSLPGKAYTALGNIVSTVFNGLTQIGSWLETNVWTPVSSFFTGIPARIGTALSGLGSAIGGAFSSAFGLLKSAWNNTVGGFGFTIPSWVPLVGGDSFKIPDMAMGGIIPATAGGKIVRVAEAGSPEAVIPLTPSNLSAMAGNSSNGGGVTIQTDIVFAPQGVNTQDMATLQSMFESTLDRHTDDVITALAARKGG